MSLFYRIFHLKKNVSAFSLLGVSDTKTPKTKLKNGHTIQYEKMPMIKTIQESKAAINRNIQI